MKHRVTGDSHTSYPPKRGLREPGIDTLFRRVVTVPNAGKAIRLCRISPAANSAQDLECA